MKRKNLCKLCTKAATLMVILGLGVATVSGCGSDGKVEEIKATNATSIEAASNSSTTEANKEKDTQKDKDKEETTEAKKELVTYDIDFSAFGEMVDKFFIATNDTSKMATRDDMYTYLSDKGYVFYEYPDSDVDQNTVTIDEAFDRFGIYLKPDFLLENAGNSKYSHVGVVIDEGNNVVSGIQYKLRACTEEYVKSQREMINQLIDSGVFEGENIEVNYNKEKEDWTMLNIYFYGDSYKGSSSKYFAKILITLDTYSSLFSFQNN